MKIIANISKVYTKNSVHSQTYRQWIQPSDILQTEKFGASERHEKMQLPDIKMHTVVLFKPKETIMWKIVNMCNVFGPVSQSSIKLVCQMSHASRFCSVYHNKNCQI